MLNSFYRVGNVFLSTIVMLLVMQSASAETAPKPGDFTFVATLSEGKQSLRQFELPYQILIALKRQDYGDMRIFNSQNQPVPFSISQLETQNYQNNDLYELRFFRLADNNASQRSSSGMQIEVTATSTRLSFNTVDTNAAQPNYLLVENQHQGDDLHALKLAWQQPEHDFSIKVKLEGSDDLQNWQVLNDSTTLYDLKYAGTALIQNTLNLPATSHAKYLRLSFQPSSQFSLQIEKISGEYNYTTSVERENWQSFPLKQGKEPNEWLFNTASFLPVTKIGFEIPSVGLFYQGNLYSQDDSLKQDPVRSERRHPSFKREVKRALHHYPEYRTTEPDPWHYQAAVTQYRLSTAAGEIASEPVRVSPTKDQHWKLVLDQPISLLPEQIPTVKLAWHPVLVTFLAQGKPPYRLFFANATVEPLNASLPPTLDYNAVETVEVQKIQVLKKIPVTKKQDKLTMTIEQLNWRKALLWLLLSAGVLVMGFMAYQLYLRMNQKKD